MNALERLESVPTETGWYWFSGEIDGWFHYQGISYYYHDGGSEVWFHYQGISYYYHDGGSELATDIFGLGKISMTEMLGTWWKAIPPWDWEAEQAWQEYEDEIEHRAGSIQ